ncbi:MAG: hypothetical protein IPN94_14920 [Sphingobacteriales bacterium]|nr:hypothetical protein [Sphingobacteriales bacterium]
MSFIGNINSGLPLVIGQDGTLAYADWFNGAIGYTNLELTALSPTAIAIICLQHSNTHTPKPS